MSHWKFRDEEISFAIGRARSQRDSSTMYYIARWYEDSKCDMETSVTLLREAAEMGSPDAHFLLGKEYQLGGDFVDVDYEKAYEHYEKSANSQSAWAPLDPEENGDFMNNDGEVTAADLETEGDFEWWMLVLSKHPTRALKCGLADWYLAKKNIDTAIKLCTESAEEGFPFAMLLMLAFYTPRSTFMCGREKDWSDVGPDDLEKARHWYRKAEEAGVDVKMYASELQIESGEVKRLIDRAKNGCDARASADLVMAFLEGDGCPKDLDRAFEYAEDLLFEENDYGVCAELFEASRKDPEVLKRYNKFVQKANALEGSADK